MEIFQINNLTPHLQDMEEQKQTKPKARRQQEIAKIREELHDIKTKEQSRE